MSRFRDGMTDEDLLTILHLHEVEGLTTTAIASRFGKSKSAICGIIFRIRTETDATDNGHGNGTMPARWWAKRAAA